jgi:transposase-like protein
MITKADQKHRLLKYFHRYTDPDSFNQLTQAIIADRRQGKIACPHCQGRHLHRHGTYRDRQRYLCKDCNRTFNDLTHTPLHRTRLPFKWMKFLQCMIEGYSLRIAARIVRVSHVTLFYWRHKLLQALHEIEKQHRPNSSTQPANRHPQKTAAYVIVRFYPPVYGLLPHEKQQFCQWIQYFYRLSLKYWGRFVAWFRFLEKMKSSKELEQMRALLVCACSIPLNQTYHSLKFPLP